jgi:hypothetical protein
MVVLSHPKINPGLGDTGHTIAFNGGAQKSVKIVSSVGDVEVSPV